MLVARSTCLLALLMVSATGLGYETSGMPLAQRLDAGRVGDLLAPDDHFGSAIALAGDVAVVGAYTAREPGQETGVAYVLRRDANEAWRVVQTLAPPDGADGDRFGSAVAISSDFVFVGAPRSDAAASDAGVVYLYRRDAPNVDHWTLVDERSASQPRANQLFGTAIVADPDTVVVGMKELCDAGGSFVETWTRQANTWVFGWRTVADLSYCYQFGRSLSLDGIHLLVGRGSGASMFRRNGNAWDFVQHLLPGAPVQYFGNQVAVSKDIAAVADRRAAAPEEASGMVQIYTRHPVSGAWNPTASLFAPFTLDAYHDCGLTIALQEPNLVVGCGVIDWSDFSDNHGAFAFLSRHAGGTDNWGLVEGGGDRCSNQAYGSFSVFEAATAAAAFDGRDVMTTCSWDDTEAVDAGELRVWRFSDDDSSLAARGRVLRGESGAGETYGNGIAHTADWLFIGAHNDSERNSAAGKVYAYRRIGPGWQLEQTILPPLATPFLFFGHAIEARDDVLVVGASGRVAANGDRTGAAFVHRLIEGEWQLLATVAPDEYPVGSRFGRALALDGYTLAIGAPPIYAPSGTLGSVYVYAGSPDYTSWQLTRRIQHGAYSATRGFGYAVALRDDTLVAADGRARAWEFGRNTGGSDNWGEVQQINAEIDSAPTPRMLAFDGQTIAIGQPYQVLGDGYAGKIDLFRRSAGPGTPWQLSETVTALGALPGGGHLGLAVELADGLLFATEGLHNGLPPNANTLLGAAVLTFRPDTTGRHRLAGTALVSGIPPRGYTGLDELPIGVTGNHVVLGLPSESAENPVRRDVGAAYVFDLELDLLSDGFED